MWGNAESKHNRKRTTSKFKSLKILFLTVFNLTVMGVKTL